MAKLSGRTIDYTQQEMMDITGLTRHQFIRDLGRLCEMYDLDISVFKVEQGNDNSEYFFIPEIAQLLAVMLRTFNKHPLKRVNAPIKNILGSDIKEYYTSILNDIDEELPDILVKALCGFEGYIVAQNIVDWMKPFIKQLTYFIVNLTTLKEQDVGKTLKEFCMKLDTINYNLFMGNKLQAEIKQYQVNESCEQNIIKDVYQIKANNKLNQSNISIDELIIEMIRWYFNKSNKIRESGFKEYILDNADIMMKFCGMDFNKLPIDLQREVYYQVEVNRSINHYKTEIGIERLKKTIYENTSWKDIITQITDNTFKISAQRTNEEKMSIVEGYINKCEQELLQYKALLAELKENKYSEEPNNQFNDIHQQYVEHCNQIEKKYYDLENVVNNFVGRTVLELLM